MNGGITTDRLDAAYSGSAGPAMNIKWANHHDSILVGKPDSDKLRYSIGRGALADRVMTVSVPSQVEYEGAGKSPIIIYQSNKKVLAAFKSGSGVMYLSGNMGLKQAAAKGVRKSGSTSNMDVHGQIRMEKKVGSKTQGDSAAWYYAASGKNPSMHFRTGSPTSSTAVDTKLFIHGKGDATRVGINTVKPKTRLDVRGHLYMQGDDRGNAKIYFPSSGGSRSGLYIRHSDKPTPLTDSATTRFFIGTKGGVGINTIKPKHGLCLEAKSGTANGEDMIISKGNLHVKDGVRDLDGKHHMTLDGENVFNELGVEMGVTVGTHKPHEGTKKVVHIKGTQRPTLMISQLAMKPVQLLLQTGTESWTLKGTTKTMELISSTKTQEKVFFSEHGSFVVGDKEKPQMAMQIETNAKELTPAQDIYIAKGNLVIKGAIVKKAMYKGQVIYWRLHPEGFSNMKDIGVSGAMRVGTVSKKHKGMYVAKGRSVDLGGFGFLYTTGLEGTLSFNEYIVTTQGQQEKKLHDKKAYAASLRLGNDGVVKFEGTANKGVLNMARLATFNAPLSTITLDKYADFGMQGAAEGRKFPLRVKGGSDTQKSTIAFGHLSNSMGLIGSTSEFAFISTVDEKKFLALSHKDGRVGIGTTTPTEELTIRTKKADSKIYFTSSKTPGKEALITMEAGGSTKLSVSPGDLKSAKFEVKEFSKILFGNAGKSTLTVFDRANKPPGAQKGTKFEPPTTEFRMGKVGIGVENPDKLLTIKGNYWSQGKMILLNGEAFFTPTTEMIELGEGVGDASQAAKKSVQPRSEEGTDVMHAVSMLARLVRKNKRRLLEQASSIERMETSLAKLSR